MIGFAAKRLTAYVEEFMISALSFWVALGPDLLALPIFYRVTSQRLVARIAA
jgi:hypothetical protein